MRQQEALDLLRVFYKNQYNLYEVAAFFQKESKELAPRRFVDFIYDHFINIELEESKYLLRLLCMLFRELVSYAANNDFYHACFLCRHFDNKKLMLREKQCVLCHVRKEVLELEFAHITRSRSLLLARLTAFLDNNIRIILLDLDICDNDEIYQNKSLLLYNRLCILLARMQNEPTSFWHHSRIRYRLLSNL